MISELRGLVLCTVYSKRGGFNAAANTIGIHIS